MLYKDFISDLNGGKIAEMNFSIDGYGHYKNCSVTVEDSVDFLREGTRPLIRFHLTKDLSERIYFYGDFNEEEKIFTIKGKGKFTLRDIWNKVIITNVVYKNQTE